RIHMERHGDRGGFLRRGRAPVVLGRERFERELAGPAHFPKEARIDGAGHLLRLAHEGAERLTVEAQQHARRLDLRALAVGRLDLERRPGFREDGSHAEGAVLLEEHLLHAAPRAMGAAGSPDAHSTISGTCSGKDPSAWSPPRTTAWHAPS